MKLVIALILVLFSSSTFAASHMNQISVGGGAGFAVAAPWATPAFSNTVSIGPRGALWVRYHDATPHLGWELSYDYLYLSKASLNANTFTGSLFWRYLWTEKVQPLFALGLGYAKAYNFSASGHQDFPTFKFRGGVDIDIQPHLELALYLDYVLIFKGATGEPNGNILAPVVGLNYSFGEPSVSPSSSKVAHISTPTPAATPETKTIKNEKMEPGLQSLGQAGSEAKLDLKFQTGTAKLSSESVASLSTLANILKNQPNMKIEIQGYTDNKGPEKKNKLLSQARAAAVKKVLISKYKIAAGRLSAVGYGSQHPLASTDNAEARALNRRVTVKVL